MLRIVERVRAVLDEQGYVGPFGVDAFVDDAGKLWPLCEINVRYTFGHVAHALGDLLGWGDASVALRFGDQPFVSEPQSTFPLVCAPDGKRVHVWFALDSGA